MATGGDDYQPHETEHDDDNETDTPSKHTRSKKKDEAKKAEDTTKRNREEREQRQQDRFDVPPRSPHRTLTNKHMGKGSMTRTGIFFSRIKMLKSQHWQKRMIGLKALNRLGLNSKIIHESQS